ncbi:MAG: hypothetical protein ACFFF9_08505 [Candidatus Thorarchaeota archaeon]
MIGRFVGRKLIAALMGLSFGLVLGFISGFEVFPLLYPFTIVQIPWVGVPEIRRVGISLAIPDFILLQESIHFLSYSLTFMSILVVVSVIGAIIGVIIGRKYNPSDLDSPWSGLDREL